MGINELSVNKHLKETQRWCLFTLTQYDAAVDAADPGRVEAELAEALRAGLFLGAAPQPAALQRAASYVRRELHRVQTMPFEELLQGRVDWGPPPGVSEAANDAHHADTLGLGPSGAGVWRPDLNIQGRMFWWHTVRRVSAWAPAPGEPTQPWWMAFETVDGAGNSSSGGGEGGSSSGGAPP